MKQKKTFSVLTLKIGDHPFTLNEFSSIPDKENNPFKAVDGNQHDRLICKKIHDNEFLSLYFEEGASLPRPSVVYNTKNDRDEKNPRNEDQIERNSQIFILIQESTQKIFISDFRKKSIVEDWMKNKIGKTVFIKDIIDRKSFLDEIKNINRIYLSASPDIFSWGAGTLSKELENDIHNYGSPIKHMELSITFGKNKVIEKMRDKARELIMQQENHQIDKLEISGRYDEKFDRVFNVESIIDKIEIDAVRKADGMFDADEIFADLMSKVK